MKFVQALILYILSLLIFIGYFDSQAAGYIKSSLQSKEKQWFEAAKNGDLRCIQSLIGTVNVNAQNKQFFDFPGCTALQIAAYRADENVVKMLLLAPDINVNAVNDNGETALILAAHYRHENIVKLLLQAPGICINTHDNYGKTAHIFAIEENHPAIEKLILAKISELTSLAFDAINENNYLNLSSIIRQIGCDVCKGIDSDGDTLLHKAFSKNLTEISLLLLQTARDPRELFAAKNKKGQIPLELINPTSPLFCLCLDLAFLPSNKSRISSFLKGLFDPIKSNPENICAHCSKQNCTKRCAQCKKVYYCSSKCQNAAWHKHKQICKLN